MKQVETKEEVKKTFRKKFGKFKAGKKPKFGYGKQKFRRRNKGHCYAVKWCLNTL